MRATRNNSPKHSGITKDILERIFSHEFGEMLPPLAELARHYGVNIKTVQKAVAGLQADGLLESVAGAGTFVRDREALLGLKPFKVGLVVGSVQCETPYYSVIGEHISRLAPEHNCSILYQAASLKAPGTFLDAMEALKRGGVDGFIVGPGSFGLSPSELRELAGQRPVAVFLGEDGGYDNVTVENEFFVKRLLNLFVDEGHERIVHLKSHLDNRRHGLYRDVLARRGLPFAPELVVECQGDQFSAYTAMKEFLGRNIPFTAIFAHNDPCAIGAYFALQDSGLRIPQDVSLSGIDDIPECERLVPKLTSISLAPEGVARAALELVSRRLCGMNSGDAPVSVQVRGKLVIRDSITRENTRRHPNEQAETAG